MKIALIAALSPSRVIGKNNKLPWHLPADLSRFRSMTRGHAIIMGRKTWESLGRPLPDRLNIIVTRNSQLSCLGGLVAQSFEEAIQLASSDASPNHERCFVIGGAEIYRLALPIADELHLTWVDFNEPGDTWFPDWDLTQFKESSREDHPALDQSPSYRFSSYQKS